METALPPAEHHARTALGLDDADPWSYFAVGMVEAYRSKYADAIPAFHRAIELNPNFAIAYGWLACALALSGQADAALEAARRAMRMSPLDPFNSHNLVFAGVAHETAERYTDALACLHSALRERPNHLAARRHLATCYVCLGQLDEARRIISELLRLQPNSSIKRDAYGYAAFARSSDQERYVGALRKAGLPEG
jgi:tetratricopeptide (TPR) repeat protein